MSLSTLLSRLPVPRIARFMAVVAIAMAAGHLAQTLAARKPAPLVMAAMDMPIEIVQLSAGSQDDARPLLALPTRHVARVETPAVAPICGIDLGLKALPLGHLGVTVTAPCHRAERVVLRHAGLAVTGKLGPDGMLTMTLPALTTTGQVEVLFGDGARVQNVVEVPGVAGMTRFGVQWNGADAFAIHALIDGADFGQPGDLSHDTPKPAGQTGFAAGMLAVLGDAGVENPLLAEIYTYPTDPARRADVVVEAAILPQTCGHDLLAEVVSSRGGSVKITELTLAMPDCSAVGDFLVLKNLASDVKIAAN